MPNDGDMRIDNRPWSGLQPAGSRSVSCVHPAGSALPFFKEKRVQIEQNFAGDLPAFCLLSSDFCILSYRPAGAGLANFAASMATLGRISLSSMVDCPSVHVAIHLNGIFTPATSR
jgi:hypothetical protein